MIIFEVKKLDFGFIFFLSFLKTDKSFENLDKRLFLSTEQNKTLGSRRMRRRIECSVETHFNSNTISYFLCTGGGRGVECQAPTLEDKGSIPGDDNFFSLKRAQCFLIRWLSPWLFYLSLFLYNLFLGTIVNTYPSHRSSQEIALVSPKQKSLNKKSQELNSQ